MTMRGLKKRIYKLHFSIMKAKENVLRPLIEKAETKRILDNGVSSIPIIINNYNRYSAFIKLVDWLSSAGFVNIIVLDNQSTYPPLLEYYKNNTHFKLVRLGGNFGHMALWDTGYYKNIRNGYYCYTDPDVFPVNECPTRLVTHLLELLWRYPKVLKAGPGLRLTDIPDSYAQKEKVLEWESKYWACPVEQEVYNAAIDTTFALYRPRVLHDTTTPALRTGEPYVMHHSPWYEDSNSLSEEEIFYRATKTQGISWWST